MKEINWNNVVSIVAREGGCEITEKGADGTLGAPVMMRASNPNHFATPNFVAPGGTQPHPVQTAGDLFMFQVVQGPQNGHKTLVTSTSGERMPVEQARARATQLRDQYSGSKVPSPGGIHPQWSEPITPCTTAAVQFFDQSSGPNTVCVIAYRYVNNQWAHAYDVTPYTLNTPQPYTPGMKF